MFHLNYTDTAVADVFAISVGKYVILPSFLHRLNVCHILNIESAWLHWNEREMGIPSRWFLLF